MKHLIIAFLLVLGVESKGWDFYGGLGMSASGLSGWQGAGDEGAIDNPIGIFGVEYVNTLGDKSIRCEHLSSVPNVGEENWGFNACSFLFYLNGE